MTATMQVQPLFGEPKPFLTDIYRKRMALMMICTHADWFRNDDLDWVTRNYYVWEAFEREANKVWDRGRRHYSARTIIEVLRHESMLREEENEHGWKINNDSAPSLARLYMLMYPERFGFFERRPGTSGVRAL